jgi:hypothetical protein
MKHVLTLATGDFQFGSAIWSIKNPEAYDVRRREPMQKSVDGLHLDSIFGVMEIVVALQQAGLFEWARSKAYNELWDYLKGLAPKLPMPVLAKIRDQGSERRDAHQG